VFKGLHKKLRTYFANKYFGFVNVFSIPWLEIIDF